MRAGRLSSQILGSARSRDAHRLRLSRKRAQRSIPTPIAALCHAMGEDQAACVVLTLLSSIHIVPWQCRLRTSAPGAECSIVVRYKSGPSRAQGLGWSCARMCRLERRPPFIRPLPCERCRPEACGERCAANAARESSRNCGSQPHGNGGCVPTVQGPIIGSQTNVYGVPSSAPAAQPTLATLQEDIDEQSELLDLHRQTLTSYLKRLARLGSAHAPPEIDHGIREARDGIRRVKATLRGWGVAAVDHPDDEGTV
jgi:hypothetical protein